MTQIIGVVTRRCVFHVSDRLLSQQTQAGALPFDRNSNKSVIFCATDAHVIAAYTGRAYLDHIPSDTFIAQSLLGSSLSGQGAFYSVGNPTTWTDVGRSVERLRQSLSDAFQRLPQSERGGAFQVSILGWRQRIRRNRRITPVIWELQRPRGRPNAPFQITRHQRWWGWDRGYTLSVIPDPPTGIVEWIRCELRQYGGKSPDEIKRILVEGLRRCADSRSDSIGYACLQVLLTPATSPQARLRYIADVRHPDELPADPIGYSPWVVAPPMAFAPALMRGSSEGGGWTNLQTGYSWVYEGPIGPQDSKQASQSSQIRPYDPQGTRPT